MKKIILSFSFLFAAGIVFSAELPSWVKSGKSSKYPQDQFLTAVGKGETEREAVSDSQNNITQHLLDTLASFGIQKAKLDISPTLFKSYSKAHAYNDKDSGAVYAFGAVDKNMLRINIEDDLYASAQEIQRRHSILDTSNFSVIPKIKAINGLLDLYERKDSVIALKKALYSGIVNPETEEFEREKLIIERKKLFDSVVYYVAADGFDTKKLLKYLEENRFDVIPELPSNPVSSNKGIITINCRVQINKAVNKEGNSYDWVADLVLNDAFNENTVLYSKTAAGDENGKDSDEAKLKAGISSEIEMNRLAEEFFKSVE